MPNPHIFTIGISGAGGSGKTTFADKTAKKLQADGYNVLILSLDRYYKDRSIKNAGISDEEAAQEEAQQETAQSTAHPQRPGHRRSLSQDSFFGQKDPELDQSVWAIVPTAQ